MQRLIRSSSNKQEEIDMGYKRRSATSIAQPASIMSHFNPSMTPREGQRRVLEEIERTWDSTDVFVIVAPTAAGKTQMAATLANWVGSASIIVPNNILLRQVADETGFVTIGDKSSYKFSHSYYQARASLIGSKCVLGYHQYLANRAYNKLLIVDEAHNLIEHLRPHGATKLWGHLDDFEDGQFSTILDVERWLESKPKLTKRQKTLKSKIGSHQYLLEGGEAHYRGKLQACLKVIPLTPRENKPIMWPPHKVGKIVLMSATFSKEDLYSLGLDLYRTRILEVDSPIPVEQRPIEYKPLADMGMRGQANKDSMGQLVRRLSAAIDFHSGEKGIIHSTYKLSYLLSQVLHHPRVLFHTKYNKAEMYAKWLASDPKDGLVLVGCGMYEGLSLNEDIARWQVILKVPYPNMTDPAIYAKMHERPESYQWEAIRHIVQAAGRVCRTPDDYGKTYIVDTNFKRLWQQYNHLFPNFFKEALHGI